eukprot:4744540-Prymnesium_polylepis.1
MLPVRMRHGQPSARHIAAAGQRCGFECGAEAHLSRQEEMNLKMISSAEGKAVVKRPPLTAE